MQLKVLSWNIWIDGYFDQIKEFLKASHADIIGLQEVQADDPERDVIGFLTDLGYGHVFAPVPKKGKKVGERDVQDGPAIFSKLPISASEIYKLSEVESRCAVRADIQSGNATLHVFSTHLLHTHQGPSAIQEEQAENLIKHLPREKTILMGDFNATPESATIQKVRAVLNDTDPSSQPTWSVYPAGCHVGNPQDVNIRLDYIFTSNDLQTSAFKVERSKGSDHLPISVVVEI